MTTRDEATTTAMRVAAIDIGSNSVRQIIADVSPTGAIRVVDEMKAAPRLGAGLDARGMLDEAAMERAIEALGRMATLARHQQADRVEVVATSAVRDAGNRDEFIRRAEEATGLVVRVLPGEEEARLGHLSARAHFDLSEARAAVMDIGGGSLELALSAGGAVERLISLPFGALRLTEQWLGSNVRAKDLRSLRKFVRKGLAEELPRRDWHSAMVIGSGGTFTNLAAIHLARSGFGDPLSVHGTTVLREDLEHIMEWLAAMTTEERTRVPGLNPARADIMVAGLAVAAEVMARLDARELTASGYGIREGILLDTAAVQLAPNQGESARERSVRALAERCRYDQRHAEQVRKLSLQLFDAIGESLGGTPEERRILADAALLHDVGYHIKHEGHHKHSYHLIVHADLLGMSPQDRLTVANVARYHRASKPRASHANFSALDKELRERVVRLAAILRVADGFDRGHTAAVGQLKVEHASNEMRICAVPIRDAVSLRLELWGAQRKSALLEDVAEKKVVVLGAEDGHRVQ